MTARQGENSAANESAAAQHKKDACEYTIDLSKQFVTFSVGGLAIAAGFVSGDHGLPIGGVVALMALLVFSVTCGLLLHMSVVGQISQDNDYDVYRARVRGLALMQVVAFALGAGYLCWTLTASRPSAREDRLIVEFNEQRVVANVKPGDIYELGVTSVGTLELRRKP